MTRTDLQPSDEELAARLLAELNAMPPSIDVEATVTGARRHRRRAVAATAGTVAGTVALVAGVVGLGMANMQQSDRPVTFAGPSTMSGCTRMPATCDPDVIDAWLDEKVVGGATTVHIGEYGPSETGDSEGTVMGAYASLVTVYRDRSGGKPPEIVGEIHVSVSTSVQVDGLLALNENEGTLIERESTWQVDDEEVTARVVDIDRGLQTEGNIDQLWIVDEDQSHGALIVWASSSDGAGRFVPSDGSGPGVTDASVQDLITRLLTEPPKQG